jgi:hypothetical protein
MFFIKDYVDDDVDVITSPLLFEFHCDSFVPDTKQNDACVHVTLPTIMSLLQSSRREPSVIKERESTMLIYLPCFIQKIQAWGMSQSKNCDSLSSREFYAFYAKDVMAMLIKLFPHVRFVNNISPNLSLRFAQTEIEYEHNTIITTLQYAENQYTGIEFGRLPDDISALVPIIHFYETSETSHTFIAK